MKWRVKLEDDGTEIGEVEAPTHAEALASAILLASATTARPQGLLVTPKNITSNEALREVLRRKQAKWRRR